MDFATFLWMFVVLKLPVLAALALIWWAIQEPDPADTPADEEDGGNQRARPHPRGSGPRPPRRGGPHALPPAAPPRVRAPASGRRPARRS